MAQSDSDFSDEVDEPGDHHEINILRHNLDEARSRIMMLLNPADQITDMEIGKKVNNIQDAIQNWTNKVELHLKERSRDFNSSFYDALEKEDEAPYLHLIYDSDETSHGADLEWMRWLGNISTCIYFVLGRHIWTYLHKNIFDNRYPIGVSISLRGMFDDILSIMRSDGNDEGAYDYVGIKVVVD